MKCPFCENLDTQVRDSRMSEDGESVKRRRICPKCDARFTTFERVQSKEMIVIKKNGDKKVFDPEKLKKSIEMAVRKRNIDEVQVEKLVNNIIRTLEKENDNKINSNKIGELVMSALEKIDIISFVRFASVYKNFDKPDDFENFIKKISK